MAFWNGRSRPTPGAPLIPDRPPVEVSDNHAGRDVIAVQNVYETSASVPRAPRALPSRPFGFTGRERELSELESTLTPVAGEDDRPRTFAVSGMGGVGKTTLSVAFGHRVVGEGKPFVGSLYLDLLSYSPGVSPLSPGQALDQLLRALGLSPEDLPDTVEEKGVRYRSALAQTEERAGRPLLVVVDNAATTAQVLPLLPGEGGSRLLVTSRRRLHSLTGVRHLSLAPLGRGEGAELLANTLRAAEPEDPRALLTEDLDRLSEACAELPLALRIAGSMLVRSQRLTPAALADRLAPGTRVARLRDDRDNLGILFDLSLRELTTEQARVFTLIAQAPGPDLSTEAARVLTTMGEEELLDVLEVLAEAHLITHDPGTDRWTMHDLLAEHGTAGASAYPNLRSEALGRLLTFYASTAEEAYQTGYEASDQRPGSFSGWGDSRGWLNDEQSNLIAAARVALSHGWGHFTLALASSLEHHLISERFLTENLELQTLGLQAARDAGVPGTIVSAEVRVGTALVTHRRFAEARPPLEDALEYLREAGDPRRTVACLVSLARSLQGLLLVDQARERLEQAISLSRLHGLGTFEAHVLHEIGVLALAQKDFVRAISRFQQAHSHPDAARTPTAAAQRLVNLGTAMSQHGRTREAADVLHEALGIWLEMGHPPGEATTRTRLGDNLLESGEYERGRALLTEVLPLMSEVGDPHMEASARNNLAFALMKLGRFPEAEPHLRRSVTLFRRVGDSQAEEDARNNLAAALAEQGRSRSGRGSGEDVPGHPGEQGEHHDEQHRADEPRPPLEGHAGADLGAQDRADRQPQAEQPVHVAAEPEDHQGAEVRAHVDDLGRGGGLEEVQAEYRGEGDDQEHARTGTDDAVVEAHAEPGQRQDGQDPVAGAQRRVG